LINTELRGRHPILISPSAASLPTAFYRGATKQSAK